jgi:hypothetical protein
MIERGYLRAFALSAVGLLALFLAVTFVVDPYGVSPLRLAWPGINTVKPKRLAIDRLIKPYEVWRDQPRTVFLGTSRLHEGIDPAVLDGTRFAPAYNASMPGATLAEMGGELEQFFHLDGKLRAVFVELFLFNFVSDQPVPPAKSLPALVHDMTEDLAPLFLGAAAIPDSLQTLFVNLAGRPAATVAPTGQWVPAANARFTFHEEAAIAYYVNEHTTRLKGMALAPQAFAALDRIVALCREHGAELVLMIAPSHPWDEYRFWSFGQSPLMDEWVRRLSTYPNVISFAQYNAAVAEPVTSRMTYWYDTLHFNPRLGELMLYAFLGASDANSPANLMRAVTPATIESVLQEHRAEMSRWISENPDYPAAFERAKARLETQGRSVH